MIRLENDDAISAMRRIADKSVNLVLCDPPYGSTQNTWDAVIPFDEMWQQLWRICKGPAVFTAMQPFSSALVMSQVEAFKHEWVWEKNKATGHLNAKRAPMRAHEVVLVFCRDEYYYQPQMTDGHKPGNFAVRRTPTPNYGEQRPTEYGGSTQRYPRSVVKIPVVNNDDPERFHPTQKPVALMRHLIDTYCPAGGTVLDFCMGSGATGVAAIGSGRSFIGIERDATYFAKASARLYGACDLANDNTAMRDGVFG